MTGEFFYAYCARIPQAFRECPEGLRAYKAERAEARHVNRIR
jgi:hypothetical protein